MVPPSASGGVSCLRGPGRGRSCGIQAPGLGGSGGPEVRQHLRRCGGGVKLASPLPPVSRAAPSEWLSALRAESALWQQ